MRTLIDGADVTDALYDAAIDRSVGAVAQHLQVRHVIEQKISEEVRTHSHSIIVGRHIKKILPEAAILQVVIDESEADRRYQARLRLSGQSVANRNSQDRETARLLGVDENGVTKIDVTGMCPEEQADALRQFIASSHAAVG